jgi:hypothetical protein
LLASMQKLMRVVDEDVMLGKFRIFLSSVLSRTLTNLN